MPRVRSITMPDIKTRDVVSGTIKAVDRTAMMGQRMKNAYVQTKKKAEQTVSPTQSSEEYAAEQVTEGAYQSAYGTAHLATTQGKKLARRLRKQATERRASPPNWKNASPPSPENPTQQPIPNRQFSNSDTSIKTVQRTSSPIKESARSGGNMFIKAPERTIKNTRSPVKTMERVQTVETKVASAKAAKNAAVKSARNTQRVRAAAQKAEAGAKAMAKATAKSVKAVVEAAQALSTALVAGGWGAVLVIVLAIVCFAGMMLGSDEDDTEIIPVSEEVKAYEPVIHLYAMEHGIGDYVLLIEAVMMQESGGRGTDPMQCSESGYNTRYPHAPGSITDPEYSINVGIQTLANCLQVAQCEGPLDMEAIKLALQGYNYGSGYITWAMNKYGKYSKANAIEFSVNAARQCGWSNYGDKNYVPHVLRYYPLGQVFYDPDTSELIVEVARSQIGNVGGQPYWSWYGFGSRVPWCACFVSWCADQCGYIESGTVPKFAACDTGVQWFKNQGLWVSGSFEPSPGMIIFFDWDGETGQDGSSDHVGIVEKVENGIVYTIEGNTSDSCRECRYPVGHYEIMGYGIIA